MGWIIFLLVIIIFPVIIGILTRPGECDVCGMPLKRTCYTWTLEGTKQKLCPRCNARMENKVSKEAFREKFGWCYCRKTINCVRNKIQALGGTEIQEVSTWETCSDIVLSDRVAWEAGKQSGPFWKWGDTSAFRRVFTWSIASRCSRAVRILHLICNLCLNLHISSRHGSTSECSRGGDDGWIGRMAVALSDLRDLWELRSTS